MEKEIKIKSGILENKPCVDQFAFQQIFKRFRVEKEYLINNQWLKGPPTQKPEAKRFLISRWDFSLAREAYKCWRVLTANNVYDATNKEQILDRIMDPFFAFTYIWTFMTDFYCPYKETLTLFVPWGVRAQGSFGEPEIKVLDKIQSVREQLLKYLPANVLLMPADLYATEINGMDPGVVEQYFDQVKREANARKLWVEPWSVIRSENQQKYDEIAAGLSKENINSILTPSVIDSALAASARRNSGSSAVRIEESAFAYLRERLCEAEIMEDKWKPVKLSAVAKNKDNGVDRNLPRVYLIPNEYQFPWLK